jgi:hypothetical protein
MHHSCSLQPHWARFALLTMFLVAVISAPDLSMAQASPFMTGASALQTNILILRCSGSENGGTSQFASRLIGERELFRRQISRGSDRGFWSARGARRSKNTSEQHVTEAAVMASQIEQLPDFCGYLKSASSREWLKVSFASSPSRRE